MKPGRTLKMELVEHDESRFVEKAECGGIVTELRAAPSICVLHVKTAGGVVFSCAVDEKVFNRLLAELYPEDAENFHPRAE
jgi:hypothetical protein